MWFHRFQANPDDTCRDKPHPGRPKSARTQANIDKVRDEVQQDCRKSIQKISEAVGTSWTSTQRILKDLNMSLRAAKFIPKILNEQQKRTRVTISQQNLDRICQDATILDRIITTDESWVFQFDPNTKQANMQWLWKGQTRHTKALKSRSQQKCMLCLFFDVRGVVFMEFLDRDEHMDSELYIAILKRMREAFRRKHPDLWQAKNFFLHQDNAPYHVSIQMAEYYHSIDQELWPHPPPPPTALIWPLAIFGPSLLSNAKSGTSGLSIWMI